MYSVEKAGNMKFLKRFEYPLFLSVLTLSALGLLILSSAVAQNRVGSSMMKTQIFGVLLGILLSVIISSIDYKDLKGFAWILYIFGIILLTSVLFIGTEKAGNKNWIEFMGLSFQPSELVKITFVIYISVFLDRLKDGSGKALSDLIRLGIFYIIPIIIIFLEKDTGAMLSFTFIFFMMLFMYGIQYRYLIGCAVTMLIISPLLWFFVLSGNNKERIYNFLDPSRDPSNGGLNVLRSIRAIGSGGLNGQGLFNGIQSQSGGVPVSESDFIFSVIGEELGFIGACLIIGLFALILMRILYIARNSREYFGSYITAGMCSILAFNFIENVGMNIGLLPVTGVPLPFVSQGGTAIVMNYIAIGLVMSVSIRRKRMIFNSDGG